MISVGVIYISYWSNASTIKAVIEYVSKPDYTTSILDEILHLNLTSIIKEGTGSLLVQNYILQCLLASIFCYIHFAPRYFILQKLLVMSFMAPSFLAIHPISVSKKYKFIVIINNYHRFSNLMNILQTNIDDCFRYRFFTMRHFLQRCFH